jgi:hypothetical protein
MTQTQSTVRAALRGVTALVGAYVTISALTLLAIVLLRNHPTIVNSAVWIRGTIVVATGLLLLAVARRAAAGVRSAYRRLRIISVVLVVAIAAIIAIPGPFPLWMKIEQGVCGLLLLGVVVLVFSRHVRSSFAAEMDPRRGGAR